MRHLDGLRIIAACAVVVLHYANYVKDLPGGDFAFRNTLHFNLFVDMFFVISGYVISSQYVDKVGDVPAIGRFIWRRLARIYPLHLATLAFYIVIAIALHNGLAKTDNAARYPFSDIPAQLLLLHAFDGQRLTFNFPSWSLSAEMLCYVVFPIVALLGSRRKEFVVAVVVIVAFANTVFAVATGSEPWAEWINQGGAFRALPGFNLGVACYLFRRQIATWPLIPGALTVSLAAFILFGSALPEMAALVAVYAIAVLAIQCDLADASTLLTRFQVDRWSVWTYSCYMLHIPVATVVITFGARYLAVLGADVRLMLIPVAILVLAAASLLSYRFIETPSRRYLNRTFDRIFAPRAIMPAMSRPEQTR